MGPYSTFFFGGGGVCLAFAKWPGGRAGPV